MRIPGADQAVDNLIAWCRKDEWAPLLEQTLGEHLDPILEEYDIDQQELVDLLGPAFSMIVGAIFEDFFTMPSDEDGRTVIDDYLKRRGWREKVPGRRYLEALRESSMSLYEVIDLEPGTTMTLRDMIRGGTPVTVHEKMGSQGAVRWDRLGARVLCVNGKHYLAGGLLKFSHEAGSSLVDGIEKLLEAFSVAMDMEAENQGEGLTLNPEEMRSAVLEKLGAPLFTQMWLKETLQNMLAPLPQMVNTDGEDILFSNVRLPLRADEDDVARVIDGIEDIERLEPDEFSWSWTGSGSPNQRMANNKTAPSKGIALHSSDELGRTSLGNLEIENGALVLSTNSRERAERGRDILVAHLRSMVGAPLISHEDVEQAFKNRPVRSGSGSEQIPPEVQEQLLKKYFDEHYRQTLDEPLPALGDKTPREAVKTEKGREEVIDWLKNLENNEQRRAASQKQKPYDSVWMWEELGLDHFR